MENKDLSRDFAIIFGIKPEEVPSNSSGNKSDFNALAKEVFNKLWELSSEQNNKLSKAIKDTVEDGGFKNNVKESNTTDGVKMNKTNKQALKEQVDELKRRSEMENSKTDGVIDSMKGLARQSGLLPLESDKYKKAPNMESTGILGHTNRQPKQFSKSVMNETDEKQSESENKYENSPFESPALKKAVSQGNEGMYQIKGKKMKEIPTEKEVMQDNYIVTFKDGLTTIITKSMFDSLYQYSGNINANGYNIVSSLLFATDSDTGEMICLDSSSILSIVKYK